MHSEIKFLSLLILSTLAVALGGGSTPAGAQDMPECIADWTSRGHFVEVDGHQIFVHASGAEGAEGVLVVHGYPGSSWDFAEVVGPVAEKSRIVVPDMLGFGQSDKPLDGTYKQYYSLMKQADI